MNREKMLNQLCGLPHPITEGLVVFDDGCEFCILTHREGFSCMVGGVFPIIGPIKLSKTMQKDLAHVLAVQGANTLDEVIEEHISNKRRKESLFEALSVLGEDAVKELCWPNWPAKRSFYVFHDMGCGVSAIFTSLQAAYEHFLSYFIREGEGISWDSLNEDELIAWNEMVERWRAEGTKKLPPREWLGAYHSALDGTTGQITIGEG